MVVKETPQVCNEDVKSGQHLDSVTLYHNVFALHNQNHDLSVFPEGPAPQVG